MIEKIVLDTKNHIFEPPEKIIEKLNYFKNLSNSDLENFTDL